MNSQVRSTRGATGVDAIEILATAAIPADHSAKRFVTRIFRWWGMTRFGLDSTADYLNRLQSTSAGFRALMCFAM